MEMAQWNWCYDLATDSTVPRSFRQNTLLGYGDRTTRHTQIIIAIIGRMWWLTLHQRLHFCTLFHLFPHTSFQSSIERCSSVKERHLCTSAPPPFLCISVENGAAWREDRIQRIHMAEQRLLAAKARDLRPGDREEYPWQADLQATI